MQKFFVDIENINLETKSITITSEDVNHIKNVLRCKEGELIEICEKSEFPSKYVCEISKLDKEQILCNIKEKIEVSNESNIKLHIFQGIPKAEKMEFIIQKCTEIGATSFTPVEMHRCVVKLNLKDRVKKIERWNKIAEVAAKQSMRDIIPKVNNIIDINELSKEISKYDLVLAAYEEEKNNFIKEALQNIKNTNFNIAVIIGPEGGIEAKEVETLKNSGAKIISLGNRILRTETAPIVLASIIMYELGDIGTRRNL